MCQNKPEYGDTVRGKTLGVEHKNKPLSLWNAIERENMFG